MELRQLRNFLAIIEQKSISRAASVVRIAQPALSRQLQALEAELGVELLVRHGWGVTPTPEGETLARHARSLLGQAQMVKDAVMAASDTPAGDLAIGVPSSMAAILLPDLAQSTRARLPRVHLSLVEGYSGNLHRRLLTGELDCAILYFEPQRSALVTRPLLTEELVAIAAPGVFSDQATCTIAEFAARSPIMPASANRLRSLLADAARDADVVIDAALDVDSVPALLALVAAGAGVSILPYSTVLAAVEEGRISCARMGSVRLERRLMLARPAERILTPALSALIEILDEVLIGKEPIYGWLVAKSGSEETPK